MFTIGTAVKLVEVMNSMLVPVPDVCRREKTSPETPSPKHQAVEKALRSVTILTQHATEYADWEPSATVRL
jgi:hypothetical protein